MWTRTYQLPQQGAFFWGFFDEVDAASGARGGWRRDPDGDHHTAGAVRLEAPDMAMPETGIAKRWQSST